MGWLGFRAYQGPLDRLERKAPLDLKAHLVMLEDPDHEDRMA